ncbi:MFS family permease [Rhodoblastus acidophilus]|uniref:MFS transporter n=1 Tax=Rhodoblastus acidophilus TaxID=1074 RepID=UPI00222583EC|nr:MFS transporter [Rhodoblastus acidophilus]MCW2317055.1 MFS family permease [Rhodoblastus acidophilus]
MTATAPTSQGRIVTDVPARLDRLPWSPFHRLVIAALGITWVLDGLEVTLAGSVAGALRASPALHFGDADIGIAGSAYLSGAVLGALFFGWLTDRMGRRKLFFITLALYLTATACAGLSWDGLSFFVFRFLTGAGIGGEYAAINSTIQELVPARYRGFTDLVVNGGFWLGAALGALVAALLLNPALIDPELGWRLAFLTGAALGVIVVFMRMWLPESPRWLALHGRADEADAVVTEIEDGFRKAGFTLTAPDPKATLALRPMHDGAVRRALDTLFRVYPRRTLVGLTLMAAQAFFYNAIFFTYALVLANYYAVPSDQIGWHILPFALTNFLGPLLLGRLFDLWGRRKMLALTYGASGALLLIWASLFEGGLLTATTQTIGWMTVFFFASPAASAAYLTVAETFPLEIRALAIALFYAAATAIGGVAAPYLFGRLVEESSRTSLFIGYLFAAALMLVAAVVAWLFAVDAEGKSLEEVAPPLSREP